MNRSDFQKLAILRTREARALLDSGRDEGAYYLLGYAIECALKACIAKQVKRYEFPDKDFAHKVYVHDLNALLKHAGLEIEYKREVNANPSFEQNWATVKDWKETARYEHSISKNKAKDFYAAVTSRKNGVLPWLKRHW